VALLQEVGFTLREVHGLLESPSSAPVWRELAKLKLTDLDRQIGKAQAARNAIEHALSCPKESFLDCPNFWAVVGGVMEGLSLAEAHHPAHPD
jgi:MerR family redox-sensitive transcriptional activator SoxR